MPLLSASGLYVGADPAVKAYLGPEEVGAPTGPPFVPEAIVGAVEVWVADDVALSGGAAVPSWVGRVGGRALAQVDVAKQPVFAVAGVGGQPSVNFDGTDDLLRYPLSDAVSIAASGHIFVIMDPGDVSGTKTVCNSASESSSGYSFRSQLRNGKVYGVQSNGDTADGAEGDVSLVAATDYLVEWASTGSTYEWRVNNAPQILNFIVGSNTGDWFADTTSRDNFVVGAQKVATGEGAFFNGKVAAVIVVDGTISSDDRAALNSWVTAKYGITLA